MRLRKNNKKAALVIGIIAASAAVFAVSAFFTKNAWKTFGVTSKEVEEYKEQIGDNMNIKQSILILFDTQMEAQEFIEKHGSSEHPEDVGMGAVPYMSDGYYNIVGKPGLEEAFDALADGEYTKTPIEYSGMYCYLKRLGIKMPTDDEIKEAISANKKLLKSEKRRKSK